LLKGENYQGKNLRLDEDDDNGGGNKNSNPNINNKIRRKFCEK